MSHSKTAIGAASQRYMHKIVDDAPYILNDFIIEKLFSNEQKDYFTENTSKFSSEESIRLRSKLLIRARFTEDLVEKEKPEQYLILGAGLDTYPYRQNDNNSLMRIFEIDTADSQAYKKELLKNGNILVPENVQYISVDFEKDDFSMILDNNGVDFNKKTIISWMGVIVYLTDESIRTTLKIINRCFLDIKVIVSFAKPNMETSRIEKNANKINEQWKSKYGDTEIIDLLRDCRFSNSHIVDVEEFKEYFKNRKDKLKCPTTSNIVIAIK
jgi:methyltransferase (TIGR00027 family)